MSDKCIIKKVEKNGTAIFLLENILDEEELKIFYTTFTYLKPHLLPPDGSGTARNEDGQPLKDNKAIFLHELRPKPALIEIFRERLFSILEFIYDSGYIRNIDSIYYSSRFADDTGHLLSYDGQNNSRYLPHRDSSIVTLLSWFDEDKNNYTGGDLFLPEINLTLKSKHNTGVIIPGALVHEVTPVTAINNNKPAGRITYSVFAIQCLKHKH